MPIASRKPILFDLLTREDGDYSQKIPTEIWGREKLTEMNYVRGWERNNNGGWR